MSQQPLGSVRWVSTISAASPGSMVRAAGLCEPGEALIVVDLWLHLSIKGKVEGRMKIAARKAAILILATLFLSSST